MVYRASVTSPRCPEPGPASPALPLCLGPPQLLRLALQLVESGTRRRQIGLQTVRPGLFVRARNLCSCCRGLGLGELFPKKANGAFECGDRLGEDRNGRWFPLFDLPFARLFLAFGRTYTSRLIRSPFGPSCVW